MRARPSLIPGWKQILVFYLLLPVGGRSQLSPDLDTAAITSTPN